jgi:hypothetical protein
VAIVVRNLRWGYAGLFWVIMAAIVLQFFLAGWGVFAFAGLDAYFPHFIVGDLIWLAMLVGVALAFAARVPWKTTGINAGLFGLMFLQAALAHIPMRGIAALHVVNAILILGLTGWFTRRLTVMARSQTETPAGQSATG